MKLPLLLTTIVISIGLMFVSFNVSILYPPTNARQHTSPTYLMSDLDLMPTMQKYVSPSPQAMAITRYGDYPVNYNTGLVDMDIPLYEINSKRLSLPISLAFHSSGRKANETNGILGMRWVLNCGGVVTRTMKGLPDEAQELTPYVVNPTSEPSFDDLYRSTREYFRTSDHQHRTRYDSEYDIFRYVLPSGQRGQFILKNENGTKKPMIMPYEALKIEMIRDNSYHGYYGAIHITDTDGTTYCYGDGSVSTSPYIEFNIGTIEGMIGSVPTGWYLRKIISADRTDSIELNYERIRALKYNSIETITVADRLRDYTVFTDFDFNDGFGRYLIDEYLYYIPIDEYINDGRESMNIPNISEIKFANGLLSFRYKTVSDFTYNNRLLEEIEISGDINRKYKFNTALHPNEKDIYYLNSLEIVSETDAIEKVEQKYLFDYYEPATSNDTYSLSVASQRKDGWGYFKKGNYASLIPHQSVSIVRMTGVGTNILTRMIGQGNSLNREPDFESTKIGMLKSITYPTGGQTVFEYEPNYYKDGTANVRGPGIRIKQMTNNAGAEVNSIRIFKYGADEDGIGYVNAAFIPDRNVIQESGMMVHWDYATDWGYGPYAEHAGYRIRTYTSEPMVSLADYGEKGIWYDRVTEYSGEESILQKKDIYSYFPKYFDTENFVVHDNEYSIQYPKIYTNPYRLWQGGELSSKTSYEKREDGSYAPTMRESYSYSPIVKEEVWDMPTYRHVVFSVDRSELASTTSDLYNFWYNAEKEYHNDKCSVFGYGFRKYVSSINKLSSKQTELIVGDNVTTMVEKFSYDQQYGQLRNREVTNSDGKTEYTIFNYPSDDVSIPVHEKMVARNMISEPVLITRLKDTVFLEQKRTTYKEWSPNILKPEKEYYRKGNSTEELLLQFLKYDNNGRSLEIRDKEVYSSYLWGYGGQYPVAKIDNATYLEIVNVLGETTINNLSSPGVSDVTISNAMNMLRNDPSMQNAQVTSYTYRPLIGMTSTTDPRGITEYYVYDSFGRLSTVRDLEGHILKTYCYNYAGQQVDCTPPPFTVPIWEPTGNTRCMKDEFDVNTGYQEREERDVNTESPSYNQVRWANNGISTSCPVPPQTYSNVEMSADFMKEGCTYTDGSAVTYTVPAGIYFGASQAEADYKAENDLFENGQDHANANGTCPVPDADISIENLVWTYQGTMADLVLYFHDPDTNEPIYVNNMPVSYTQYASCTSSGSWSNPTSLTVSGSSFMLQSYVPLDYWYYIPDPDPWGGGGMIVEDCEFTYTLDPSQFYNAYW